MISKYEELVGASKACQACPLYERATQTVFGEGPTPAPMFLVGEQPGDQEDGQGHPFVGPAGRILDAALERAAIHRSEIQDKTAYAKAKAKADLDGDLRRAASLAKHSAQRDETRRRAR